MISKQLEPATDLFHARSIGVINQIFETLRHSELHFGVLHGLEGFPDSLGRDIDIMVANENYGVISEKIRMILHNDGWDVGLHEMSIGVGQLFARLRANNGRSHWIEIDLIHNHPFCWLGQEIVPIELKKDNLIDEKGWTIYPWGWFAKNVLIQALAGNQGKFQANARELRSHPSYFPMIRVKAAELGFTDVTDFLLSCLDSKQFSEIRRRSRHYMIARAIRPKYWINSIVGFSPWLKKTFRLHFPSHGCAPKIHVIGDLPCHKETFFPLLLEYFNTGFPFTSFVLTDGKELTKPSPSPFARLIELLTHGPAYYLRESSRLVLQIEYWKLSEDPPNLTGCKITAGDFIYLCAGSNLLASVEELGETISDAFLKNLN